MSDEDRSDLSGEAAPEPAAPVGPFVIVATFDDEPETQLSYGPFSAKVAAEAFAVALFGDSSARGLASVPKDGLVWRAVELIAAESVVATLREALAMPRAVADGA